MSNNISTMYTRHQNKTEGRRGYGMWKREKEIFLLRIMECFGKVKKERKSNLERGGLFWKPNRS